MLLRPALTGVGVKGAVPSRSPSLLLRQVASQGGNGGVVEGQGGRRVDAEAAGDGVAQLHRTCIQMAEVLEERTEVERMVKRWAMELRRSTAPA